MHKIRPTAPGIRYLRLLVTIMFSMPIVTSLALPPQLQAQTMITLSPTSGTVGTETTLEGKGFTSRFVTICWDDRILAPKVPINNDGELRYKFNVPDSPHGDHSVRIKDFNAPNNSNTISATFTVIPHVTIFPDIGKAQIPVTIVGKGFAAFEKDIKILWNDTILPLSVHANQYGSWGITFEVPDAPKGEHFITVKSSTTSKETGVLKFTIAPVAKAEPTTGPVGTEVRIKGVGFRTGEDGITITYDGEIIKCNIVGGADGSWDTTIKIPASTSGYHIIGVYGSSFTPKGIVPDIPFKVIPKIELQPNIGNTGDKIALRGTGFTSNESVNIDFDGTILGNSQADSSGCLEFVFQVPQSKKGEHIVAASGNFGNHAETSFTVERAAPEAPQLLYPTSRTKVEIFGSASELLSTTVAVLVQSFTFWNSSSQHNAMAPQLILDWTDPAQGEQLTYTLQISQGWNNDFLTPIVTVEGLTETEYKCNLPRGYYTWRVKAIDDMDKASPWSEPEQFQIAIFSSQTLTLFIAFLLLVAITVTGIWFWTRKMHKTR